MKDNYWGAGFDRHRDEVTLRADCETCGKPVEFIFNRLKPSVSAILHDGCEKPIVTMLCHNPQKLGVVTAE